MELAPLKLAFPTVVKLLQIAMTVCVSTAKCERSFSALKRIKTYLRSSMSKQRLTDMAILSIERDFADSLILSSVVDVFARKSRRIALCWRLCKTFNACLHVHVWCIMSAAHV